MLTHLPAGTAVSQRVQIIVLCETQVILGLRRQAQEEWQVLWDTLLWL